MLKRMVVLLALVAPLTLAAVSPAYAGAVKGPRRWSEKVPANDKVVFNIEFRGGQTAEFAIIGDGDTDVDVFVRDANGRLVASDTGLSDLGLVRWRPAQDQVYRIEVVNLGGVWNLVRCGHN
jgi:hypothetical protein